MGKGAKWAVGIAAALVVGAIVNAVGGDQQSDSAAPASPAVTTTSVDPSVTALTSSIKTTALSSTTHSTSTAVTLSTSAAVPTTSAPPIAETTLAAPAAVVTVTGSSNADGVVTLLDSIPVKGRAAKVGYDRALFGSAWTDDVNVEAGHNGCDTRNDVLRRDLTDIEIKPGSNGCVVLAGVLHDLYTGATVTFTRGDDTSPAVQIDHVVALSDAWQKGAQQLTADQRRDMANDPLNLQTVDGATNSQKGDGDAATWLPPNGEYRCTYVSRQVQIKTKYGLWVTQAEHDAILKVLARCGATVPASATTAASSPATAPPKAPVAPAPSASQSSSEAEIVPLVAPTSAPKTTTAPKVAETSAPAPATTCYPLSKAGNCYKAGQFCAKAHHGTTGIDANGKTIRCIDNNGWRWTH